MSSAQTKTFNHSTPFEGLVAKLPKGKRTPLDVLRALAHSPRVSTWDMDEHPWLTEALKQLHEEGLIQATPEAFPWHSYRPTTTGKARIAAGVKS